jgi:gas vesicle protein
MNSGKVLLGVLAGVAAGALLGILFAPDKGVTTRKKIVKKGEDYADAVKEKFDGFLEDITSKVEEVKEGFTDFTEHVKAKVTDTKKEAKA